jgi:DNA invertase Pin-like site-specific DNA recombinase
VTRLQARQSALLSLEERTDTSSAAGELVFQCSAPLLIFRATPDFRAYERRHCRRREVQGQAAGRQPLDMKVEAAIDLIEAKTSLAEAARQLWLGRSTIYREMKRFVINRTT